MKILLVSLNHFPEQTGIGKFQGEMAAWFGDRGHTVRVITAPPYYPAWKIDAGYHGWRYSIEKIGRSLIYRVPIYVPRQPTGFKRLLHLLSFALSSLPVLLWQALAWRPDALIATAPPLFAAPAVLMAARLAKSRACLHVQDFEIDAAFGLGLLRNQFLARLAYRFECRVLKSFPLVTTISPRMRDRLIAKGVKPERAFLIPNWAGIDDFAHMRPENSWTHLKNRPEDIIALYAGNLGRKQGVETVVEAARLLQTCPRVRVVICGDGAARADMQQSAADLNNIVFLPVQKSSAFIALMTAADLHLLPQKAQAADLVMPSKLGNMLASGRPVVAGALPGTQLQEAVTGCGLAVPPDDPVSFAAAIRALAEDASLRARLGNEGRQRAIAEWSRDSILLRLERLLTAE